MESCLVYEANVFIFPFSLSRRFQLSFHRPIWFKHDKKLRASVYERKAWTMNMYAAPMQQKRISIFLPFL